MCALRPASHRARHVFASREAYVPLRTRAQNLCRCAFDPMLRRSETAGLFNAMLQECDDDGQCLICATHRAPQRIAPRTSHRARTAPRIALGPCIRLGLNSLDLWDRSSARQSICGRCLSYCVTDRASDRASVRAMDCAAGCAGDCAHRTAHRTVLGPRLGLCLGPRLWSSS